MGRSNLFANFENKFRIATEEQITSIAQNSVTEIIKVFYGAGFPAEMILQILVTCAKIGLDGHTPLSIKEKNWQKMYLLIFVQVIFQLYTMC